MDKDRLLAEYERQAELGGGEERLQRQGEQIIRFAGEEGLFSHAEAIRVRLENK